jgi:hypothetical protein
MTNNVTINKKVEVLKKIHNNKLSKDNACSILGKSKKTLNRYIVAYDSFGIEGLQHGNSNRVPHNTTSDKSKEAVTDFYNSKKEHKEFNFTHLYEFFSLTDYHKKAMISYSTFRQILIGNGIVSKKQHKRRGGKKYGYSSKTYKFGEVIEMDGCETDWFGDNQKPKLHLAVDRGTGAPLAGHFEEQETTLGYFKTTKKLVLKYGFPMEMHTDKRMSFTNNQDDENFTQFERVMVENDVYIQTCSIPESKPCVERMNQTFEDRLRSEFIYHGINTKEKANEYIDGFIDRYNESFGKITDNVESVFRPVSEDFDFNYEFSFRTERVLRKNRNIHYNSNIYEIVLSDNDYLDSDIKGEVVRTFDGKLMFESYLGLNELKFIKKNKNPKSHPQIENHPWKSNYKPQNNNDKVESDKIKLLSENVPDSGDRIA